MNIVELCAFCNLLFFYHICMSDEFAVGHLSATYKARCYTGVERAILMQMGSHE